jgi:hypothetical protein
MKDNLTICTQNENEFVKSDWLLKGDSRSIQATILILNAVPVELAVYGIKGI